MNIYIYTNYYISTYLHYKHQTKYVCLWLSSRKGPPGMSITYAQAAKTEASPLTRAQRQARHSLVSEKPSC